MPINLLPLIEAVNDLAHDLLFDEGVSIMQDGPWNVDGDQYLQAATSTDLTKAHWAYDMARQGITGCEMDGNMIVGWLDPPDCGVDCCSDFEEAYEAERDRMFDRAFGVPEPVEPPLVLDRYCPSDLL